MGYPLSLSPDELELVITVIRRLLSSDSKVWVFGSRATGNAKRFSDLDLLIDNNKPMSLELLATLSNAFAESPLAYKVDIVDAHTISKSFLDNISKQLVQIIG